MRIKRFILYWPFLAILFSGWPMMSLAGEINLPQTGQITCYDESGEVIESGYVIDCSGTGQDGDVQAGVFWPAPRFTNNGDGTVVDHLTGLIWLRNANCFGLQTWGDALSDCNSLASGSCGLTDGSLAGDWRLPNVVELESLVNIEVSIPASWLISQGFTGVQSAYCWSASTYAANNNYAWVVNYMGLGTVNYQNKTVYYYVWPVRGGQ